MISLSTGSMLVSVIAVRDSTSCLRGLHIAKTTLQERDLESKISS